MKRILYRLPHSTYLLALGILTLIGCKKNAKESYPFVISEVMASNKTGLLADDGKLHDWIEITNTGEKAANLKGCTLVKDTSKVAWELPDTLLQPGCQVLIFASKKDIGKQLHCNFKLPNNDGEIRLMTTNGDTLSEVTYKHLKDDQALALNEKGKYKKTYEQTPGLENTSKGYKQYLSTIEAQRTSPLRIWEFQVKHLPTECKSEQNRWVELKNTSKDTLNLQDYVLTTSKDTLKMAKLPMQQLAPGEIYTYMDKASKLSGTYVTLMKGDKFVDGVNASRTKPGVSIGCKDGQKGLFYFDQPTQNAPNTSKAYLGIQEKPDFETKPGPHAEKDTMSVELKTHGLKVFYTIDGSEPTASSTEYKSPIKLTKTTTIRAIALGDSTYLSSSIATATYFLHQKHDMAVMNITVKNSDLYDNNTGIYVPGPNPASEMPHKGANYWKHWTKKAHVEYYDEKGSFSEDCGLAIFGGFSRVLPRKSFKIKFKHCYGPSSVSYDIYNEGKPLKMNNFVLRSGSQDIDGVMVRDEFFTSLMKQQSPTLPVQAYRPVALYINAEYFGLYYVREKVDKYYVANRLNVSTDSVTILMSKAYREEGSSLDYLALLNYAKSHNLAEKEPYEYMCSQVDLVSLIDQKLGEIYSHNTDVGNIRYIRSTDANCDKKWRFVFYDLDATWMDMRTASFYLRANGSDSPGSVSMHNVIIHNMLKNKEFRKLFLERLSHHMHKTFTPENTKTVFDNLVKTITEEMKLNCQRWPEVMTFEKWQEHCKNFRAKFDTRYKVVLDDLRQELSITAEENKKYFDGL